MSVDERRGSPATRARIAITADWLTTFGGGERVLRHLRMLYPEAPIFTSVFAPNGLPPDMRAWDVRPSALQRLPGATSYSRLLLPFMPGAFRRFDFANYDVVITTSSAFSKNVGVAPGAVNLCYCYTPPRYLWDLRSDYARRFGPGALAVAPLTNWLRTQDLRAASRVDEFVAISDHVADRIARTYRRTATVIYPPVDTDRITPDGSPADDFLLVVSRLVAYKRIDLAVDACTRMRRRLVVVGAGPELRRLRARAGPTVQFVGHADDTVLCGLYARCKAFLFPGLDDFGITPVEAQAAGRPVIALGHGGATETVLPGVTGVLFENQTVDDVVDAIERLDRLPVSAADCRTNAERFDSGVFRARMSAAVDALVPGRRT